MKVNNGRFQPSFQSTTGNGLAKCNQLPNKALLHQVVSATQSWSSHNAAFDSLQPSAETKSTMWRSQVPQEEMGFPLRKTLSVPAGFRSPPQHTHTNVCNGTKPSHPPPISPLLTHQTLTASAPAYCSTSSLSPNSHLNFSQWSPFPTNSKSVTSSTSNLWYNQPSSLPVKRSYSSGAPLSSPLGRQDRQTNVTRQGASPKCLSLPTMSPGSKEAGNRRNVSVSRPLLSDSPVRSSPKPGRNLSTPPSKKRSLRHRKLGFPEPTVPPCTGDDQNTTEDKPKEVNTKKPKSLRSYLVPLIVILTISAATIIAIQPYCRSNINKEEFCSISAFEEELNQRVFGQHIAKRVVLRALSEHLTRKQGSTPLVMSFYGPSGVGKTFLSRLLSRFLSESCGVQTHEFIIPHHFPHSEEAELYRQQVHDWVRGNVTGSDRLHLFVFDEMEKVFPALAEGLQSILEQDASNTVYVFISSTTGIPLSKYVLEQLRKGRSRESIGEDELKNLLRQLQRGDSREAAVADSVLTGSSKIGTAAIDVDSNNIPEGHAAVNHVTMETASPSTYVNLMDKERVWSDDLEGRSSGLDRYFVPFLPLEREHVMKCAEAELAKNGQPVALEAVTRIVDEMKYYPEENPILSKYGCKRLSVRVDLSKEN